jgi:hypothetical protein
VQVSPVEIQIPAHWKLIDRRLPGHLSYRPAILFQHLHVALSLYKKKNNNNNNNKKKTVILLHSLPACTVLLLCFNHFIDVYCRMFIAAVEFMLRRSRE